MSHGIKPLAQLLRTMGTTSKATPEETAAFEAAGAAVERLFPNCPKVALVGGDGAHPIGDMLIGLLQDLEEQSENLRNMAWLVGDMRQALDLPEKRTP